jgi:hypothetical protein
MAAGFRSIVIPAYPFDPTRPKALRLHRPWSVVSASFTDHRHRQLPLRGP